MDLTVRNDESLSTSPKRNFPQHYGLHKLIE